jgi:hypothetical protein
MNYTFYIYISVIKPNMLRTRLKKVLLVAPDIFPEKILTDYKNVKHVSAISCIFPAIYELNPDIIVFDYDYIGKDIEEILRRIKINKFYNKLKICCYKDAADTKTESMLKALGADRVIYREDLAKSQKNRILLNNLSGVFDISIMKWVAGASH